MPFIKSEQAGQEPVNIFYHDCGKGQPIVLVHGWPVSHEMWEYQAGALVEQGYRVIAYDRRGFGQSDKPWTGYDYTTLAGDLKAVIDGLKLEDVILVGFSMGGGEVVRYCTRNSAAHLAKIVLVSSIVPYMLKTDSNPDGVEEKMFDEFARQIKDDRPAFLAQFGKTFFGQSMLSHPVSQEILDWMQGLALRGTQRATIACMESFAKTDFRAESKTISIPTLIIHGDADKTVPIKPTGEQASRLIPDALFKKYEGAPHGLFITEKEQLTADLLQFIKYGTVNYDYDGQPDMATMPGVATQI